MRRRCMAETGDRCSEARKSALIDRATDRASAIFRVASRDSVNSNPPCPGRNQDQRLHGRTTLPVKLVPAVLVACRRYMPVA